METESAGGLAASVASRGGGETITALIIDDEPHVRAFLHTALRSLGVRQVSEATNGAEGVEMFDRLQPSLVLLDINMPVMAGETAIQHILAADPDANVIMLTSDSRHEVVRRFLDLGAAGYVLKHRPADGARAALRELLERFDVVEEA